MAKRRSKGEGSIYFNDNIDRWVAQISLPNGQRRSKSSTAQKEVRDWLIDQRNKLREGLYVTDDQIKLGDFLDRYMEDVASLSLRPRTYQRNYDLVSNQGQSHTRFFKLADKAYPQIEQEDTHDRQDSNNNPGAFR